MAQPCWKMPEKRPRACMGIDSRAAEINGSVWARWRHLGELTARGDAPNGSHRDTKQATHSQEAVVCRAEASADLEDSNYQPMVGVSRVSSLDDKGVLTG